MTTLALEKQVPSKSITNMTKNLLKSGSAQEPLTLLYRNGQAATSAELVVPRFTDICLTKSSQAVCEDIIEEASHFEHTIHNDNECQDYIALHSLVDETLSNIRKLTKNDREPFNKILSQITAAIEPVQTSLISISSNLKKRITEWRELVLEGQRREEERLRTQAEEKRAEAKYTDDPKKQRQASVQAKQLEKEAKAVAPKPEKGVDTEVYWVATINNRVLAAKLPDKLVPMDPDQTEVNKHLKALERAGAKITPNILPGLTLERKTRVRFHR